MKALKIYTALKIELKMHYNEAHCVVKVWSRVKSRPDGAMLEVRGEFFDLRNQNSRVTFM